MKTYAIYKHPIGTIKVIKKGWGWPAFWFSWIWTFIKRLYVHGIVILIAMVLVDLIFNENPLKLAGIIYLLAISIWLGICGNELTEKNLKKRGYEFKNSVEAETKEGAIALFITGEGTN